MLCYLYDGSFEGLLTAIHEAYYRRETPDNILPSDRVQQNFLDEYRLVDTDPEKSQKVYQSILYKISADVLKKVYHAFLTEHEECGIRIYRYLKLGWKMGPGIVSHLSHEDVLWVDTMERKVTREMHRFLGLLRFSKLKDDIYYAVFEPDYSIVGILTPHFVKRFSSQRFILHDKKRSIGTIYDQSQWYITDIPEALSPQKSEAEDFYIGLWKQFFKSISIPERKNPRLQMQHMPKKYWKHLTEKSAP